MKGRFLKTISLALIMSFSFAGCGYSLDDVSQMKAYKKTGKANAINYIEEKYGFTPSVNDVANVFPSDNTVPNLTPAATGTVHVSMEYEGKEFTVEISGEEETVDGADDYEKTEILDGLKSYIKSECPSVEDVSLPFYETNYYFKAKFTGDNYSDYFDKENYAAKVIIKTCNQNLTDFPLDDLVSKLDCNSIAIIDYKSNAKMPDPDSHTIASDTGYNLKSILPYINQYLWYSESMADGAEPYIATVNSAECNGVIACGLTEEPISIEQTDSTAWNADSSKTLLGSYYIESNDDNFYVYFNRPNDIDASTIAINSGDYNITTEETGDYIYFWAYMVKSSSEEYNRSFQIDITTSNE